MICWRCQSNPVPHKEYDSCLACLANIAQYKSSVGAGVDTMIMAEKLRDLLGYGDPHAA